MRCSLIDLLTSLQHYFPGEGEKVRKCLDEDPTLKEIAENYLDCVNALKYWRHSKAPEAQARIAEYSTFSNELEQEALDVVKACLTRSNV